jgi:peptidyl-prolyl cis-trans isomerase C
MSRFLRAAAVGLVLAAGTVATAPAQQAQPAMQAVDAAADPILAIVDGAAIRRSDIQAAQRALPAQFQQMPLEMILPMLVDQVINQKLLSLAGRREKIQDEPDLRARVASYEDRLVQNTYLSRKVAPAVTDAAVEARYRKIVAEVPAESEVSARHILVASEQKAKEIIAALARGGDFAKLAAENTLDPSGKDTGGDLGFFRKGEMVPEFSEMAFSLKEGQTADRPVKTQFGWHVIRVDKVRSVAQSLDDLREEITSQIQQEVVAAEIEKLRAVAKIERFNADGTPAR